MSLIPPEFDPNSDPNGFKVENDSLDEQELLDEGPIVLSPEERERLEDAQQKLRKIFLILLGVGALIGLIVAIALVFVLNHFGLVGVPDTPPPQQQ